MNFLYFRIALSRWVFSLAHPAVLGLVLGAASWHSPRAHTTNPVVIPRDE